MLFAECVQRYFRTYLMQQRGYGKNTLGSYRDTFKLLIFYLANVGIHLDSMEVADLSKELVSDYLMWLEEERKNAVSTRNVRLAHIKSFASFVTTISPEDAGSCMAIASIAPKKRSLQPPDCLSREEVGCLLAAPGTKTAWSLRDSALLSLLYDSACRAQEIVDLDVSDLSLARPSSVNVKGKGQKTRRIPLMGETGDLLASYVASSNLRADSPLFVNRSGRRLTRAGVSHVVERHWKRVLETHPEVALHDCVKPHLLRHTKATHLVEEGVNIYYIRDFLGHASVTTTQIYLKSSLERMRSAIESAAGKSSIAVDDFYTPDKKEELLEFLEKLL